MAASEDEPGRTERTLRSFGNRLGGLARRVSEIVSEVSGQISIPEELRDVLNDWQRDLSSGELEDARNGLETALEDKPDQPLLASAWTLLRAHCALAGVPRPDIRDLAQAPDAIRHLEDALAHADDPDRALDATRRALRAPVALPSRLQRELQFVAHCLAARARTELGYPDRAIREWHKAHARMADDQAGPVLRTAIGAAVDRLLEEDRPHEALDLCAPLAARDEPADWALALLARAQAAVGDRPAAAAALSELESGPDTVLRRITKLRCALTLPELEVDTAFLIQAIRKAMEADPTGVSATELDRLEALAELARVALDDDAQPPPPQTATRIVTRLVAVTERAPRPRRDRHLAELAHACWRLGAFPPAVVKLFTARAADPDSPAPDAIRIAAAFVRPPTVDDDDFEPGPPPRFRAGIESDADRGPSPESPLRKPSLARRVHDAAQSLVTARYAAARGDRDSATDLVVMALVDAAGLPGAREAMADLVVELCPTRLEDLLQEATGLLLRVPNRVLGVSLQPVADALARVVAARERLARPLTIAIMGEFSSGKSTFVNALLREELAPMGLLPTTSTINVFRRGTRDVAWIHDRDGRVTSMGGDQISAYLRGLDTEAASRIHHVEVERPRAQIGDAAVVDTPGLNALDPYHERVAREYLDEADAVVWIFSATRGGAASEGAMLSELRAGGRRVLGVLNKADTLSADEQQELRAYLADELGEVLVDVLPLSATEALAHRTGQKVQDDDPFGPVEAALETHFLSRARELKHAVTLRRVQEALQQAQGTVEGAIEELRAAAATVEAPDRELGLETLHAFATAVDSCADELADRLTREAAGLGIVSFSVGIADAGVDVEDLLYLAQALQEAAHVVVSREVNQIRSRPQGDRVARVLHESFVPWSVGFTAGRLDAETLGYWVRECGPAAKSGEAALRTALARQLEPFARALAQRARRLAPELARCVAQELARVQSAPQAEALRLQVAVGSGLDALLRASRSLAE